MLLNRLATGFGFRKKDGLFIGFVLTAEVMLLPLALRYNFVLWWLGITALTTISPAFWRKADTPPASEEIISEKSMPTNLNEEKLSQAMAETVPTVELEQMTETESEQMTEPETELEMIVESEIRTESSQTNAEAEPMAEPEPEITLEDLINCGFAAKNAGRFQSAAEWFTRALSLHPEPDLAFYLIMDACSLWLTVNKRDQAQGLLMHYWPEYERLLAHEQRTQLSAWLSKENLLG